MKIAAIIVAAGRGRRMGGPRPKILLTLAGRSILSRAVTPFLQHPQVGRIVIAVSGEREVQQALGADVEHLQLVAGGERRRDSVLNALAAIGDAEIVLVHDAARPLVDTVLIDAVIDAAVRFDAAVPVTPVAATVKQVDVERFVTATIPRHDLGLAQTPQGFKTKVLRCAFAAAPSDFEATDEAALVERLGVRVRAVDGSPHNIKITVPSDLALAEAFLSARQREGSAGA